MWSLSTSKTSLFSSMLKMPKSDPGRPSRYHHGNLKKAMVQTAIQLIEERGEASFTIRELAKSVGVSQTAAYRHFRSKRELLAQIVEEGFHGLQAQFDEILRKKRKEELSCAHQETRQCLRSICPKTSGAVPGRGFTSNFKRRAIFPH
jgi:AcrR family transcriptional regulator